MKVKFYDVPERRKCIAVARYGGKNLKGVAVAAPEDEYNIEVGRAIALARVNVKIAERKQKWARKKYDEIAKEYAIAKVKLDRAADFVVDATYDYNDSLEKLHAINKHYS